MEVFWPANALCSARDNLFEIYAAVTIADAHYTVSSSRHPKPRCVLFARCGDCCLLPQLLRAGNCAAR